MPHDISPRVTVRKVSMAASVFRHQDGGRSPVTGTPVVPVTPPAPILIVHPPTGMPPRKRR